MGSELTAQGRELGKNTKNNCKAALKRYRELMAVGGRQCFFVLTAGMAANKDDYPAQTETMAEMMKTFLCQAGIPEKHIIVSSDRSVWGSRAEIEEAAAIAASKQSNPSVLVISTWYHIPRLFVVCLKQSTEINWGFASTSRAGRFKDVLWEIIKFFGELLNIKRRLT